MKEIQSWAKWVARDSGGELWIYENKPVKIDDEWASEGGNVDIAEEYYAFRVVSWNDEKPVKIVHHKDETKELIDSISLHEYGGWHAGTEKTDPVNHPSHYNIGGIETIGIIKSMLTEEEYRGYLKGNILKYRERAEHKGNPEQDYAKAKVYYDWLEGEVE